MTPGKPTATVSNLERAAQCRRDRARLAVKFENRTVRRVAQLHDARITRQSAGRFTGNAGAILQLGAAGLTIGGKRLRVDMEHDLVALGARAADRSLTRGTATLVRYAETGCHRALREQTYGIRTPLARLGVRVARHTRDPPMPGSVRIVCRIRYSALLGCHISRHTSRRSLVKQRIARSLDRTHEQRPYLRHEPAAHHVHAVVVRKHRERARAVPLPLPYSLILPASLLPRAHHPLQLRRRRSARQLEQLGLTVGARRPSQRADLGKRQLTARH